MIYGTLKIVFFAEIDRFGSLWSWPLNTVKKAMLWCIVTLNKENSHYRVINGYYKWGYTIKSLIHLYGIIEEGKSIFAKKKSRINLENCSPRCFHPVYMFDTSDSATTSSREEGDLGAEEMCSKS